MQRSSWSRSSRPTSRRSSTILPTRPRRLSSDSAEQVFVTVAAGLTITYFESKLPAGTPVVRAMPNAAALVGAGVTALAKGRFISPQQLDEVSALFDAVGGVLTVPEQHLDAVTAVSGSGPAYFFLLVEALVDAGVGVGLTRQVATDLAAQTMAGSAAMLLERMDQERRSADGEPVGLRVDAITGAAAGVGHFAGRNHRGRAA